VRAPSRGPAPGAEARTGDVLATARLLERVAVLVAAGVPTPRAWALATRAPGRAPRLPAALRRDVEGVLAVADETGAPVVPALRALAAAIRETAETDRAVRVALAGPRTSARVVLALPLFGVVLGATGGADTVGVLLGSPAGWMLLVTAVVLVVVAERWTARLVRAVTPDGSVPGLLLDAWAIAVSGGGAWSGAGARVEAVFGGRGWPGGDEQRLAETLELAEHAGVPAAGLLRASAVDLRAECAADGLADAERLAVRLVVPLGVCVLPAFVLVGVVPVVVGLLSSTGGLLP
jgi:tight adherence protein B